MPKYILVAKIWTNLVDATHSAQLGLQLRRGEWQLPIGSRAVANMSVDFPRGSCCMDGQIAVTWRQWTSRGCHRFSRSTCCHGNWPATIVLEIKSPPPPPKHIRGPLGRPIFGTANSNCGHVNFCRHHHHHRLIIISHHDPSRVDEKSSTLVSLH